ncbi:hypothetical protein HDV00_010786 [Rhizophlyctis rosea]|nr:hypothetical protein HDV00_010786 [Rhizophlyctis rosea]
MSGKHWSGLLDVTTPSSVSGSINNQDPQDWFRLAGTEDFLPFLTSNTQSHYREFRLCILEAERFPPSRVKVSVGRRGLGATWWRCIGSGVVEVKPTTTVTAGGFSERESKKGLLKEEVEVNAYSLLYRSDNKMGNAMRTIRNFDADTLLRLEVTGG